MDVESAIVELEETLGNQIELAGDDEAVVTAGAALVTALRPAIRQLALSLASMAAEEIDAQLPEASVDVVLSGGEPSLIVRTEEPAIAFTTEDLEARLTLRLPDYLKAQLEEAAGAEGDSINSFVVKTLASKTARARRRGRKIQGTIQT